MEWITPHSGGRVEILRDIDIPNPCNPTQLGLSTSLHGVPTPEDTLRTFATISFIFVGYKSFKQKPGLLHTKDFLIFAYRSLFDFCRTVCFWFFVRVMSIWSNRWGNPQGAAWLTQCLRWAYFGRIGTLPRVVLCSARHAVVKATHRRLKHYTQPKH